MVGHSFLPPDRVFGFNEKLLKKKNCIVSPNEYIDVYKQHATVIKLNTEATIFDWMGTARNNLRPTSGYHFELTKCRRIFIKRNRKQGATVRGEQDYDANKCQSKSLLKPHKHIKSLQPTVVTPNVVLHIDKIRDIKYLIELQFGEEWKEQEHLRYWVDMFNEQEQRRARLEVESDPNSQVSAAVTSTTTKSKRGRGRPKNAETQPKKQPENLCQKNPPCPTITNSLQPKRGRGRPKSVKI